MYQQALNIQPDNPLASNNLAYVMLQQGGNVDVALAMAQTARRGMPDSPQAAEANAHTVMDIETALAKASLTRVEVTMSRARCWKRSTPLADSPSSNSRRAASRF